MSFVTENCVRPTSRVRPSGMARAQFREDAHLDYYRPSRRSCSRHTRAGASKFNRVGSRVSTKPATQRLEGACKLRAVEGAGVSGREPASERARSSILDNSHLFVRQFRYKPRSRPSVKSAVPDAFSHKGLREVDSLVEGAVEGLRDPAPESATRSHTPRSSAACHNKKASSGKVDAKVGRRKMRKGLARAALSSSSSSESSSCDEAAGQPTRNRSKTMVKGQGGQVRENNAATQSCRLRNSAVPVPPCLGRASSSAEANSSPAETKGTLFVCQGKGCAKRGGNGFMDAVLEQGSLRGLEVVGSKCMKRCKYGPVMVATFGPNAEEVEFTGVDPGTVGNVLDEMCAAKKAVASL